MIGENQVKFHRAEIKFIGTRPHSLFAMLSMAVLGLRWPSWTAAAEATGPPRRGYSLPASDRRRFMPLALQCAVWKG